MDQFYKTVTMDLESWWDRSYTYRIGGTHRPVEARTDNPELCTAQLIHASHTPEHAAGFADSYPFRLLVVEGKPLVDDGEKAGFRQLRVVEGLPVSLCFGPVGAAVVEVLDRVRSADAAELDKLAAASDAAWDAASAASWDAAWDAASPASWDASYAASRAASRAASSAASSAAVVHDLVGQHGLEQHHIDTLMAPYVEVFGRPSWMHDERA